MGPLCTSASAAGTVAIGRAFAHWCRAGDVVLIDGPLGAGKTTFVQGMAAGLGVTEQVTSPTFVLARPYGGRIPLVHVDAYRLGTLREVEELGLEDWSREAVTVVEWGVEVAAAIPDAGLVVRIAFGDNLAGDELRTIEVEAAATPSGRLVVSSGRMDRLRRALREWARP